MIAHGEANNSVAFVPSVKLAIAFRQRSFANTDWKGDFKTAPTNEHVPVARRIFRHFINENRKNLRHTLPLSNSATGNVAAAFRSCRIGSRRCGHKSPITAEYSNTVKFNVLISASRRGNRQCGSPPVTALPAHTRPEALEHSNWSSLNNASDRV